MYKKLVFLITLALVLGLAGNASAVLVGHWPLDGDACDISGSVPSHDGTLKQGDPNTSIGFVYDAGRDCNVLDVNNPVGHTFNSVVDCNGSPNDPADPCWADILGEVTLAAWTKVKEFHNTHYLATHGSSYQLRTPRLQNYIECYLNVTNTAAQGTTALDDGEWHHVAFSYDPVTGDRYVYTDGNMDSDEGATGAQKADDESFVIGGRLPDTPYVDRGWNGWISDVRLYSHALPYGDIRALAGNDETFNPVPTDGAVDQDQQLVQVSWSGQPATSDYRVYFGTDEALVTDACDLVDKLQVAGGADGNYTLGTLAYGTVYYWRADANMSGTIAEGDTWEFTVAYGKTTQPSPWDGCKYVKTSRQLSWKLGYGAINTELYISPTQQWVIDACDSIRTIIAAPTNTNSPALVVDTTYYWRADSNAGALFFPGDVWSFSTDTTSPEAGLVGYWPLDEKFGGSTVTWDISGNEHHGTLVQGDVITSVDIVSDVDRGNVLDANNPDGHTLNSAVQCGGGNTDIDPWAEAFQDQITLMAWTKVDTIHTTNYLITMGASYQFRINQATGAIQTYMDDPTDTTQSHSKDIVTDGKWHHVAFTYDNDVDTRLVYTDGNLDDSDVADGPLGTEDEGFVIGGRLPNGATNRGWDGLIDDVKLYGVVVPGWKIRREGANCATCVGDLDANSVVNLEDLNILVGALTSAKIGTGEWVINPGDARWNNCSDMDVDGEIDLADLNRMIGNLTWRKLFWDYWYYSCGTFDP